MNPPIHLTRAPMSRTPPLAAALVAMRVAAARVVLTRAPERRRAPSARANARTAPPRARRTERARAPVVVARATDGDVEVEAKTQSSTDDDDVPIWERRELEKRATAARGGIPWPLYLLGSVIVLIAATGSVFEYAYGNPIFGVVTKDSWAYAPILGWFVFTGYPLAGWFWMKGISGANEASEMQDKIDGY